MLLIYNTVSDKKNIEIESFFLSIKGQSLNFSYTNIQHAVDDDPWKKKTIIIIIEVKNFKIMSISLCTIKNAMPNRKRIKFKIKKKKKELQ